jgi:hypothetical protein
VNNDMGEKDSGVLGYAAERGLVAARWHLSSRFRRIPPAVIAVGTLVFFHLVLYFGLDRFLSGDIFDRLEIYTILAATAPIFIQRRGWRTLTLAIGIAVALSAVRLIGFFTYKFSLNGYVQTFAPNALLTLLVACLWILSIRRDKARAVIDACLLAITVGVVMIALNNFFWHLHGYDAPLFGTHGHGGFAYSHIVLPYCLILMIWIGIPFVGRDRGDFHAALLMTYYSWFALPIAASVFYLFFLSVWIAGYSFDTGFPFDRAASANTMGYYGVPNVRFWRALDHADWDRPTSEMGAGADWRNIVIYYLLLHDPGAPKHLAAMLVARPKRLFADAIADGVAKAGVFDAVPIFLRYAFVTGSDKCSEALFTLGVRQCAWAVFSNALRGHMENHSAWFSPMQRSELSALLGADKGDDPYQWESLLEQKAHGPKPPIPATVTSEADDIVQIFSDYGAACWSLKRHKEDRFVQLAAAEGLSPILEKVARHEVSTVDPFDPSIQEILRLLNQAAAETSVAAPDWDAPDTPSLRREVEAFEKRIKGLPKVPALPIKLVPRVADWPPVQKGSMPVDTAATQRFRFFRSGASAPGRAE